MKQILQFNDPEGRFKNPSDIFNNIKDIKIDYTQENMIVMFLNTKLKVIGAEIMFKGGLNSCVMDQRTIYRNALLHNAEHVIIAHNHPSDDLQPSTEDITAHEAVKHAGKLIGITCLDSIIFNNNNEYYSMAGVV